MRTSKSLSWSELKVGIIIIVALVILAVGVLQLGGKASFFTRNYTLYVFLDNTYGLKVGSTVRLAGLDVGNVEDIKFPTDPRDKRIILTLKLQEKFKDRIREDSSADIKTLGLLGDKYVEIEAGTPYYPVLKEGTYIKGGGETQISRVLSGATSGLEGLNVVVGQLKDILGNVTEGRGTVGLLLKDPRLYNDLESSAAQIELVAKDLGNAQGSLGKFIKEPALYNNLVQVSSKTRDLVEKLNQGSFMKISEDKAFYENLRDVSTNLKSLSSNLESGSIAKISNDKELYARIDRISSRLDSVIAKLEDGKGSAGKLLSDEALYNNMDKFFKDADSLVVDFQKNPKKYVHISLF